MEYVQLGKSEIKVSKLCFGSLTITPYQGNLSLEDGAKLISYAYDRGINFIDTAELYDNYEYIRRAIKYIGRQNYIISTKTYAYDKKTAEKSLEKALKELNTDYIDIFLLHEQESIHTIKGHYEAIEFFEEKKRQGVIRAIGISTHKVFGADGFNKYPNLDIIHPMLNYTGLGILDGSREDMESKLQESYKNGSGIYAMKVLGGGHHIPEVEKAINYIMSVPFVHSFALGMQSKDEVDCNIEIMETGKYPDRFKGTLNNLKRRLIVADYCSGCSRCVNMCRHSGIDIIKGQACVNEKCILCGYCANYCPDFCIKVV